MEITEMASFLCLSNFVFTLNHVEFIETEVRFMLYCKYTIEALFFYL